LQVSRSARCYCETDHDARQRKHEAKSRRRPENFVPPRAERHPHSNLMRPPRHSISNKSIQTNRSKRERKKTEWRRTATVFSGSVDLEISDLVGQEN
jgi:hypothetical protein